MMRHFRRDEEDGRGVKFLLPTALGGAIDAFLSHLDEFTIADVTHKPKRLLRQLEEQLAPVAPNTPASWA